MNRRILTAILLSLFVVVSLASPGGSVYAATSSTKTPAKTTDKSKDAGTPAQSTPTGVAGVQSYSAASDIPIGTIVELKDSKNNVVAVSTQADSGHMYGVIIDPNTLSLQFTDSSIAHEVYVGTSGTHNVLVSSQNGDIKTGDYVTLSSVDGVAMKATEDDKTVFGRAAANFNSKNNGIGKVSLKDKSGKELQQAVLGMIPVSIDVKSNPIKKSTKTNLPQFLQRLGEQIAEKQVSPVRVYLSVAITVICVIAAIVILYSGIRNGLIAIGRNPLSKKSIFRGLLEIIFTSILILIIGLFAVYLLLKL